MKNLIIIGLIALGLYYYSQENSASSVASDIQFDGHTITYNDETFVTDWSDTENINGYVRSINDKILKPMPIITKVIAITTGDFSNSEKTRFEYNRNGYLVYNLHPNEKLKGTVTIYNLIPNNKLIQDGLDAIQAGNNVSLSAKFSTTGKLRGEKMEVRLNAFEPNEWVPNKMTTSNNPNAKQYIALVESI